MKKALGIDIGGTKIYCAVIDENGKLLSEVEKKSTPKTFVELKSTITDIVKKYEKEVDTIAFATAGAVNNANTGVLGSTGNLPKEYPTINFQSFSSKPVFVENDANCAAWSEFKIGAAKGMDNSVTLTLGTGVGGGIIVNGKLLKGKNGAAGEMHFKMRTDRHRPCTCGSFDCFECYASGNGLKWTGEEILGDKNITTYQIMDGVRANDKKMIEVFNKWQDDILLGIRGLANLFDPDCIILSGSMAQFTNVEYLEKATNNEIVTTPTKVLKATAGNFSGMIGASLLALEALNG